MHHLVCSSVGRARRGDPGAADDVGRGIRFHGAVVRLIPHHLRQLTRAQDLIRYLGAALLGSYLAMPLPDLIVGDIRGLALHLLESVDAAVLAARVNRCFHLDVDRALLLLRLQAALPETDTVDRAVRRQTLPLLGRIPSGKVFRAGRRRDVRPMARYLVLR